MSMKRSLLPRDLLNPFIQYCEDNGWTYVKVPKNQARLTGAVLFMHFGLDTKDPIIVWNMPRSKVHYVAYGPCSRIVKQFLQQYVPSDEKVDFSDVLKQAEENNAQHSVDTIVTNESN